MSKLILNSSKTSAPWCDSSSSSLVDGLLLFAVSVWSVPGTPRESQAQFKCPSASHLLANIASSLPSTINVSLSFSVLKSGVSAFVAFLLKACYSYPLLPWKIFFLCSLLAISFIAQARSFQMVQFSLFWPACIPRSRIVWKLGLIPWYSYFCIPKPPNQPTNHPASSKIPPKQPTNQRKNKSQNLCKTPRRDYLPWADWQGLTRGYAWKRSRGSIDGCKIRRASRLSVWVAFTQRGEPWAARAGPAGANPHCRRPG